MNDQFWPDGTPKSWGNAFTHGYGHTPHGYQPGAPVADTPKTVHRRKGGFGANNGTIPGMREPPKPFTLHTRKRQLA